MTKHLIIVESPAKARTIQKFLNDDYKVMASMGHVRDLPSKKLGFDPENHFMPQYEIPKDKKKTITELKKRFPRIPAFTSQLTKTVKVSPYHGI